MFVEKSKIGNRLKRVFPKFEADRSHVRGVNGRSKFDVASAGFAKRKQFFVDVIFCFGVEKSKVANRLKRVLPKFRADRSHVRGVNGRSKFAKNFEIREIGR